MKDRIQKMMIALAMVMGYTAVAQAQSEVSRGAQVTQESAIVSGGKYVLQSMASGTPYITDAGTYYSVPTSNNKPTTASVYYFFKNDDGTWRIRNQYTGKYWGTPVYSENLMPSIEFEAGAWTLNISGGIAFPRAKSTDGETVLSIDRSSSKIVGWTTKTSNYGAQTMKIYEVEAGLSSEPLLELEDKMVSVSATAADNLTVGQWYTMYDRGNGRGYLYENSDSHALFNIATAPSGTATSAAKFLVRLSDAGDGSYYVQDGFGNYFGAIADKTQVSLVATPSEAVAVKKIANTDGHFYLQCISTGVILDANDYNSGNDKATVVGWGTTVPTSTGGNNDWAFYPVTLEDVDPAMAIFDGDVTVSRGYQTTGRGNRDALLLRMDVTVSQTLQNATFRFALDAATRNNISSLYIYDTKATEFIANIPEAPVGQTDDIAANVGVTVENVTLGLHRFWLCATVKDDATLGAILKPALTAIDYTTSAAVSYDASAIGNPDRQGMKVFDQQVFVCKPTTDDCRYYRIPAMILDEDGNIVIAADKRYNSNSDLGNHKIDVISKRSEDGGRTWKDYTTVAVGDGYTAAYFGYGDAALARATNGDLICIMAAGSKMWGSNANDGMKYAGFARSTDNGKTWTLVKNLFDSPAFYDENNEDGSLSVANIFTTSGKGLTTTDGIIMFTTNCRKPGTTSPNLCYILYSTDNGNHWRLSKAEAYSGCDESKLEQRNDGSLLLSVRQSGNRGWNTATYTKNADGTVTFNWGSQYRQGDIWGNACNADILYYSRQSETDPDIMLHSFINTSGRQSLQLSISLNGGSTWTNAYNIQPNGSCYSTMIQLPSGNVALLFEDESYSAGNGYAINFVTVTRDQILEWFQNAGGELPTGIKEPHPLPPSPKGEGEAYGNDENIYNLAGQRLSKPQRGVNIVNGKKIIKK